MRVCGRMWTGDKAKMTPARELDARAHGSGIARQNVGGCAWCSKSGGRGALESALAGKEVTLEQGLSLSVVRDDDFVALVKVANELRRQVVGDRITYVVNRNLNFTNVCIVGCSFCGFGRSADAPDAYFHSNEALIAKAEEAVKLGATEVCIQGGLPKRFGWQLLREFDSCAESRLPDIHIHAYSPMEITYGTEKTRLPLREFLAMSLERRRFGKYSGHGCGDSR